MKKLILILVAGITSFGRLAAQEPQLHVNPKWSECSFQLDPSLTQSEFHQFAQQAGIILYFRPLIDAKPLGAGHFNFSIVQTNTPINESDGAWNNTFVHPDSTHWLVGGPVLPFPGLLFRAGITSKIDAGAYWTVRPGANYGVLGFQLQYNFLDNAEKGWASSCRLSTKSLYGPDDLNLNTFGVDLVASKRFSLLNDHATLTPYAGTSFYLSHVHEKSDVVALHDENRMGLQANAGVVAQISIVQLAAEYNIAAIPSFSYRLGVEWKFGKKD